MKYDLSVICPGIRTKNWEKLYNSVGESFQGTWEIVFVGPYDLPEELKSKENIRYIKDWGSPIRCQQIGLISSRGDWINWAADDGYFLPQSHDVAFEKLRQVSFDSKYLVMGKYREGDGDTDPMTKDAYYILSNHDVTRIKWINNDYYMLNVGVVSRELLLDVGGWDAENFEVCPMAYNDLAIRLQKYGVKFLIQDELMFKCGHMSGHQGDHGPIHDAQVDFDQPRFRRIYMDNNNFKNRIKIDINNWKLTPEKWIRRFGK